MNCYAVSLGSSVAFSLDVLVSLLRQENAVDICVINIPANIQYADYLVVVSGISTRHLRAMALYAVKVVKIYTFKCSKLPCAELYYIYLQYYIYIYIYIHILNVGHFFKISSTSILRKKKSQMSRLKERTQRTGCALTLVSRFQVLFSFVKVIAGL